MVGVHVFWVIKVGSCPTQTQQREAISILQPAHCHTVRLLGLLRKERGHANRFKNVIADGPTPPEVENTRGVKDECLTSLILRS